MLIKMKKAQGATEYAIFIAAVLAGLLALQVYYKRSVQGNTKSRADSIGEQYNVKDATYKKEFNSFSTRNSQSGLTAAASGYGGWSKSKVSDDGAAAGLRSNAVAAFESDITASGNAFTNTASVTKGEVSRQWSENKQTNTYDSDDGVWDKD